MGGRDVIAHIKDALAAAHPGAVDDEVTEYVADMANELLAEGDLGRSPAEMAEELVDAAGPMLAEFIDDEAIKSLFDDAVAHHLGGGDTTAGDGSSAEEGAQTQMKRYCLDLDGIILAFAGKVLLRPTSLKLERGKRYGMVGQNGAGKTTLLTRLAAGDINGFPPDIRCVFVQHEVLVTLEQTILAFMTSQASTLDANVKDVVPCLEAVGFTPEMIEEKMVSELSGGWRMRLAIARAMLQKADLLLLDEPTNHLDVNAVEWLAGHLTSLPDTTTLVVSHDYDFLTDVATDIVHFEGQELTTFGGGFPGFRAERPNLVLPRMKRDMVKAIEENAEAIGGAVDGGDIHDARPRASRERKMQARRRGAPRGPRIGGERSQRRRRRLTRGGHDEHLPVQIQRQGQAVDNLSPIPGAGRREEPLERGVEGGEPVLRVPGGEGAGAGRRELQGCTSTAAWPSWARTARVRRRCSRTSSVSSTRGWIGVEAPQPARLVHRAAQRCTTWRATWRWPPRRTYRTVSSWAATRSSRRWRRST
jgi:ABC-type multidrug transport system ATPase subunit